MRKMRWTEKVGLAAAAVITLGPATQAAGDESTLVSALTTPQAERPAVVFDPEVPAGPSEEAGPPEAGTESPTLPTPADAMEPPPMPDSILDTVIGEAVVVTFAPDHLRRPLRLP